MHTEQGNGKPFPHTGALHRALSCLLNVKPAGDSASLTSSLCVPRRYAPGGKDTTWKPTSTTDNTSIPSVTLRTRTTSALSRFRSTSTIRLCRTSGKPKSACSAVAVAPAQSQCSGPVIPIVISAPIMQPITCSTLMHPLTMLKT